VTEPGGALVQRDAKAKISTNMGQTMIREQLIRRANEIVMARTGRPVPEEDIKDLLEMWESSPPDSSTFDEEVMAIADDSTHAIFRDMVDEILMAKIGHTVDDFPNPNDEMIEIGIYCDIDWDNLDQYGPGDFIQAAEDEAAAWIAGLWDEEAGEFK